jgi:hypothetical protein
MAVISLLGLCVLAVLRCITHVWGWGWGVKDLYADATVHVRAGQAPARCRAVKLVTQPARWGAHFQGTSMQWHECAGNRHVLQWWQRGEGHGCCKGQLCTSLHAINAWCVQLCG